MSPNKVMRETTLFTDYCDDLHNDVRVKLFEDNMMLLEVVKNPVELPLELDRNQVKALRDFLNHRDHDL